MKTDSPATSFCGRCRQHLPKDAFWRNNNRHCGTQGWCIVCIRAYRVEYKEKHGEPERKKRLPPRWSNQKEYHAWYYQQLPAEKKKQYMLNKRRAELERKNAS